MFSSSIDRRYDKSSSYSNIDYPKIKKAFQEITDVALPAVEILSACILFGMKPNLFKTFFVLGALPLSKHLDKISEITKTIFKGKLGVVLMVAGASALYMLPSHRWVVATTIFATYFGHKLYGDNPLKKTETNNKKIVENPKKSESLSSKVTALAANTLDSLRSQIRSHSDKIDDVATRMLGKNIVVRIYTFVDKIKDFLTLVLDNAVYPLFALINKIKGFVADIFSFVASLTLTLVNKVRATMTYLFGDDIESRILKVVCTIALVSLKPNVFVWGLPIGVLASEHIEEMVKRIEIIWQENTSKFIMTTILMLYGLPSYEFLAAFICSSSMGSVIWLDSLRKKQERESQSKL